jgi:hypothetical protein
MNHNMWRSSSERTPRIAVIGYPDRTRDERLLDRDSIDSSQKCVFAGMPPPADEPYARVADAASWAVSA